MIAGESRHKPVFERLFHAARFADRDWQSEQSQEANTSFPHIAHRGLFDPAANRPENSLAAFRAAIAQRLPFECDCRFSREGEPIVFHDATARRMAGLPRPLSRLSRRDVGRLKLGRDRHAPIPELRDVLALTAGKVPIFLEVKAPWLRLGEQPVARLASIVRAYSGPIAIMSFHPGVLTALRAHRLDAPLGLITCDHTANPGTRRRLGQLNAARLAGLRLTNIHPLDFIAADVRTLSANDRVARFRKNGTPVLTWTVRTPDEWRVAQQWADAAIFEPDEPSA